MRRRALGLLMAIALVAGGCDSRSGDSERTAKIPAPPPPASSPAPVPSPPPPSSSAPSTPDANTARDSKATDPTGTLTKQEQSTGMPEAGQANNHSSPSLEKGKP